MKKFFKLRYYIGFLAPALILYFLFTVVPVIKMIPMAFQDTNGTVVKGWVGLEHFETFIHDDSFWTSMVNVGKIFLVNVIAVVYSWLLGFRLSHINGWINKLARFAFMFPLVLSVTTFAKYGVCLFSYRGLVNDFLDLIGLERISFISSVKYAMWTCAVISAYWTLGSGIVGRYSAIKCVPKDLREAAALDGATQFQTDLYVILPLMNNHHTLTIVTTISGALMTYSLTSLIATSTAGLNAFNTPISLIISKVTGMQYGEAAAYSLVYFIFCVGISLLLQKFVKLETYQY